MTNSDAWNKIVAKYNKNINCKEEIIQASWELLFSTIFEYPDSDIISQYPVQMGSTSKFADILIRHENEDLFVVELKQHSLAKQSGQEQLFSYLNQLKIDIGILICDKLYIYDFDYTKRNDNFSFVEISFTPDNPDGIKFVELFKSENIGRLKIKEFIMQKKQSESNIESIKNELTHDNVVQIVKKHLAEKYPIEDVEKVMTDIFISVSSRGNGEVFSEETECRK